MNELELKEKEFNSAYNKTKEDNKTFSGSFMVGELGDSPKYRKGNFTKVDNKFLSSGDYTCFEKLVAIILKKHCIKDDYCWPSIETIARKVPCGVSTVKKSIKSLMSKGVIAKEKNDEHRSNMYVVNKRII